MSKEDPLDGFALEIKAHWAKYRPQMYRELEQDGRLDQSLYEASRRTGEAFAEQVEHGLEPASAWEAVREEWAFLPAESAEPSPPSLLSPPASREPMQELFPPSPIQPSADSPGGARKTIPGRNGGTLTPFQPGVSGNPHRGPDRFPGRNVVRAMFLVALAAEGVSVEDLRRKRKHRKGAKLIPGAMAEHCKQAFRNIAIDAALGKLEAYRPFLRMMTDAHAILQPAKDEVARAQDRVPMPATFVYANDEEPAAPADGAAPGAPPPPPPDGLRDANGQEYV